MFRYADEIFSVGQELQDAIKGQPSGRPIRFVVGMPDVLPKLIAYRLLRPAFQLDERVHVVCHEGRHEDLLAELAVHRLDIVLSDSPTGPTVNVRAFNHLLGKCGVTFFARANIAAKCRPDFPQSLDGAPLLVPAEKTALRRSLDQWFYDAGLRPRIIGEFEDTALMKVFGQDGIGIFPAPSAIEKEVCRQYRVRPIGQLPGVHEHYYAISVERRLKHPAVVAICQTAREELFA